MGKKLRMFGFGLLALAAWLFLAGASAWIPESTADGWGRLTGWAGLGALALGMAGSLLAPLWRAVRGSRCVRCGVSIERGQTYCLDHLQETVNQYRDQAHQRGY
ncbi:MAG TPA: hypothetical protein VJS92_16925 [Candidatus Polarisedimenticolaceae bacterium]|nr:hypothetical protein [Candidatus Polarisedimenticolaceae bacterium]